MNKKLFIQNLKRSAETVGKLPVISIIFQALMLYGLDSTRRKKPYPKHINEQTTLLYAQLKKQGFAIIENYLSFENCAELVHCIQQSIIRHPSYVIQNLEDKRIHGFEHHHPHAMQFLHDPRWLPLCDTYTGSTNKALFVMANYIMHDDTNKYGSGGGWHRDGFPHELKMILYLSDVSKDHGPFQLLCNSQKSLKILGDMWRAKLSFMQRRIKDAQIEMLNDSGKRVVTLTGKAGTVLIFDTSFIHSGSPIQTGERYALTLYTAHKNVSDAHTMAHYAPVVTQQLI